MEGEVYPRVCGGTITRTGLGKSAWGLSPRVRGNRMTPKGRKRLGRSIPACAGEPILRQSQAAAVEVYPRVCGGTNGGAYEIPPRRGLSPRVRGNQIFFANFDRDLRSIPACAGEPA